MVASQRAASGSHTQGSPSRPLLELKTQPPHLPLLVCSWDFHSIVPGTHDLSSILSRQVGGLLRKATYRLWRQGFSQAWRPVRRLAWPVSPRDPSLSTSGAALAGTQASLVWALEAEFRT